jgi:hypothetical protein
MKKGILLSVLLMTVAIGVAIVFMVPEVKKVLPADLTRFLTIDESLETDLQSHLLSVQGERKLQVASVQKLEAFTRTSRLTLFKRLNLPEVVVRIQAPVTYTYVVDLKERWSIEKQDGALYVYVSDLEANLPAVDLSQMEMKVDKPSLFRDEDEVLKGLQSAMMPLLLEQADAYLDEARSTARTEIAGFVRAFIASRESKLAELRIEVRFPGEGERLERLPAI